MIFGIETVADHLPSLGGSGALIATLLTLVARDRKDRTQPNGGTSRRDMADTLHQLARDVGHLREVMVTRQELEHLVDQDREDHRRLFEELGGIRSSLPRRWLRR